MSDTPKPCDIDRLEQLADSGFAVPPDNADSKVIAFLCRFWRENNDPPWPIEMAELKLESIAAKEAKADVISRPVCANCHQLYIRHHALAPHRCPSNRDDGPITEFAENCWMPLP